MKNEAVEWANNQVKQLESDLKVGEKWRQIQAQVKLKKIYSLTDKEYKQAAIESYKTHLKQK